MIIVIHRGVGTDVSDYANIVQKGFSATEDSMDYVSFFGCGRW